MMMDETMDILYECYACRRQFSDLQAMAYHKCSANNDSMKTQQLSENTTVNQQQSNQFEFNNIAMTMSQSKQSSESTVEPVRLWNRENTLFLIDAYQKLVGKMQKKKIWENISKQLSDLGHKFTPSQVENRWQTLYTRYKNVKDTPSGSGRKVFEFEEEMDQIFHGRPNITPKAMISSNKAQPVLKTTPKPEKKDKPEDSESSDGRKQKNGASKNESSDSVKRKNGGSKNESSGSTDDEHEQLAPLPKKRHTQATAIIEYLERSKDEQRKDQQQRHDEKMSIFRQFLDVLKSDK